MESSRPGSVENEKVWKELQTEWDLREGTIYLNHGSFGPPPRKVQKVRDDWSHLLDSQPMDFFWRKFEPALLEARSQLAKFVRTQFVQENIERITVFRDRMTIVT